MAATQAQEPPDAALVETGHPVEPAVVPVVEPVVAAAIAVVTAVRIADDVEKLGLIEMTGLASEAPEIAVVEAVLTVEIAEDLTGVPQGGIVRHTLQPALLTAIQDGRGFVARGGRHAARRGVA